MGYAGEIRGRYRNIGGDSRDLGKIRERYRGIKEIWRKIWRNLDGEVQRTCRKI
jgi:hypothetical protein